MNENQNNYVDINAHDNYPDSEQKIEIPTMKVIPLKKICMTIGELPTSYLETMTYYEMLVWFIEYLRNNIIPTINNNASAIQEVQTVVLALQNYINDYKDSIDEDVEELEDYMNNYFENLDVQEEINNKLDEMLEDGVLEQIIEQFLQLTSLICFDNVAEMKTSVNLANGSFARTLGHFNKNDGGGALYKIRTLTNDDVIDEMIILEMTNDDSLIAELIIENNEINSMQAGCKINDSTFNNGIIFNKLLNYANEKGVNVKILHGDYYVSTPIIINEKLYAITIDGLNPSSNLNGTKLIYTGNGYCLTLAKGGLKYTIKNLTIECNNSNNGINCEGVGTTTINFKNYLTNISVTSAIIGMRVVSTTYTMIDNFTFGGDTNTEVGLQIEGFEFTYINNCSIDGYSKTDSNSIALKITGGLNYYINNMDLCNFGQGKAIYLTNNTYNLYSVYFNNINIIRCDGGVVIENGTHGHISSIKFDNILMSLSGTNANSHYFYAIINNSYNIQYVSVKNLTIRNLANTTLPEYVYEQNTGGIYGIVLEIKDYYNAPLSTLGIKGSTTDNYQYKNEQIRMQGMKYITTDGSSWQYDVEFNYPRFSNIPFMIIYVVNRNDYKLLNPQYDATTGKLKTTLQFATQPTAGNIKVGYMISNQGSNS